MGKCKNCDCEISANSANEDFQYGLNSLEKAIGFFMKVNRETDDEQLEEISGSLCQGVSSLYVMAELILNKGE